MALLKPTPGPWTLSDDAVRRVIKGAGAKPRTVCIIESWTTEPDAHMLAAAPDLYAALKACLDSFELAHAHKKLVTAADGGIVCACDLARAALRKAGGDAT